jgi:benzil reductase ((S)-benzoin forming)
VKTLYIITGSSKGIGKALTERLLKEKDSEIIGIARTKVEETERLTQYEIDLSDIDSLIKNLPAIFPSADAFEKVVLINNAGILGDIKPIGKLSNESIQQLFNVNTIAPAILMNAFVEKYSEAKAEKLIINISSGAAHSPYDGWSGYCSSKAALNMWSLVGEKEAEINKSGIRYFAISPGVIDTQMQDQIRKSSKEDFSNIKRFKELKENNLLLSPELVAERLYKLIENPGKFQEVVVDLR